MTPNTAQEAPTQEEALRALALIEDIWEMAPELPYTKTLRAFIEASSHQPAHDPYLCIAPACGPECSGCNCALSPDEVRKNAKRYMWLRAQPNDTSAPRIDVVHWTADDESANGGQGLRMEELDAAIDAALAAQPKENTP